VRGRIGKPSLELPDGELAQKSDRISTLGVGQIVPAGWKDTVWVHPTLQGVSMPDVATTPNGSDGAGMDPFYNKYVVHDVAQILLRHLPRVDITSGY
jgi:poly [ADP-ribose] polymerase